TSFASRIIKRTNTTTITGTQGIIIPAASICIKLIVGSPARRSISRRDGLHLDDDIRQIQECFELLIPLCCGTGIHGVSVCLAYVDGGCTSNGICGVPAL